MRPIDSQQILKLREDPAGLEQLYRENPSEFATALGAALGADRESMALRVWEVRLASESPDVKQPRERRESAGDILLVIFLCLVSGTMAKLPLLTSQSNDGSFYLKNVGFLFLPAIAGYFLAQRRASTAKSLVVTAFFVVAAMVVNAYPSPERSQSVTLASLHLPFLMWAVVGYAFATTVWRDNGWRIDFLRLNGEAIIYTALVLVTGVLMTAITLALFDAIGLFRVPWYSDWVAVYGACSAPIVGMHLAVTRTRIGFAIAPLIARIFSPLALLTLIVYLSAIILQGRSLYADREFLIAFNAMLLTVLGIAVFCICERRVNRFSDVVLCALLLVALMIDLVALSAIIYRLGSFGLTPNRVATLVTNVLVFIHLAGTLVTFLPAAHRLGEAAAAERWIARFLPAYAAWTAVVVFLFPTVFGFR